ncbi:MAG: hypothetical protein H0T46_36740 [Deltaproteobacteria bacterium]|nr:hypothetical protein [Deltaproteobacteria bacterium]
MRALLRLIPLLVGCSSTEHRVTCNADTTLEGDECVATPATCGTGTREVNGACEAIALPAFHVVAPAQIVADAARPVRVLAYAENLLGEAIVFRTDRPGAGDFTQPTAVLDVASTTTRFAPCNATTPGCLGPLRIEIARASAPTVAIAAIAVELIAGPKIGSAERCLDGGNVLSFEGRGFVYPGDLTITDGVFRLSGGDARAVIDIVPSSPLQGSKWSLVFDTVQLGQKLLPGVYLDALQGAVGHASLNVTGQTPFAACRTGLKGEFEVIEFEYGKQLTATFREWCLDYTNQELTGCVHVEL